MGKHLLKTVMAVTLIGAAAYCLKRFSDELVCMFHLMMHRQQRFLD